MPVTAAVVRLRGLVLIPLILAGLLLAGTAWTAPSADAATRDNRIREARGIALKQIGDPYRYGASGPEAFDCSGLIYYSYRKAGLKVPRTSSQQAQHARHIPKRKMRSGDLMFFHGSGGVYHAAIFLRWKGGKAYLLHSPNSGSRVHRTKTWTSQWFGGTLRGR